jgi:uncharacterized protein
MKVRWEAIPPEGRWISLDELPPVVLQGPLGEEEQMIRLDSAIEGSLFLQRTPKGVEATGSIKTAVSLQCARCLKEFQLPIVSDFEEFFILEHYTSKEQDRELGTDDMDASVLPEEGVDIKDVVEEQVWLNIPMKPLCHDGCKGLCSVCGADLNREECGCDCSYRDHRFAVLKNFRSSLP